MSKINHPTDSIVEAVKSDLTKRSEDGIKKYGTTLDRDDLELIDWLNHQYEELLDAALYCKRAILKLRNEKARQKWDENYANITQEELEEQIRNTKF